MRVTTVAENLIRKYGRERFRRLVGAFRRNEADARIALRYGVTARRVGQWRRALGWHRDEYRLFGDVVKLLSAEDQVELRAVGVRGLGD